MLCRTWRSPLLSAAIEVIILPAQSILERFNLSLSNLHIPRHERGRSVEGRHALRHVLLTGLIGAFASLSATFHMSFEPVEMNLGWFTPTLASSPNGPFFRNLRGAQSCKSLGPRLMFSFDLFSVS